MFAIKHTSDFRMSKDNLVLQYDNMSTPKATVTVQGRWAKVRQALTITWHCILRYVESSQGVTVIKEVNAHSIRFLPGSMGFNAWNTFVLRIEHHYIV